MIHSDPLRLRQVLLHLLGNAAKFTKAGSIVLKLERSDTPDDLCSSGDPVLRFSVIDTGPGIPATVQSRIFQPFEQGSADVLSPTRGTGLGLAISSRLAVLFGGSLRLTSEEGCGSTFVLTVPLRAAASHATGMKLPNDLGAQMHAPVRAGLRILVAEDTPASQTVIRLILERLGHSVMLADNGLEAVDACRRQRFDVIFMDLQMPELDGLEATRVIRKSAGPNQSIPIIALSAFTQVRDRQRAAEAGMSNYLHKPVNMNDVSRLLTGLDGAVVAWP